MGQLNGLVVKSLSRTSPSITILQQQSTAHIGLACERTDNGQRLLAQIEVIGVQMRNDPAIGRLHAKVHCRRRCPA
ncbi:MAG: hypothetical protein R3E83_11235 [Burkholderiaceae bacterium]